ncbi:MAG: alpha/beta fold hydrolase [Candidatus Methanomethylophilaceae archaeon]|nr:alpha/beta fold hydrolase [Candidatus Methanomethylophilaceae archaeon]
MFADVNGIRLAYDDEGSGIPLVFIGGFCTDRAYFSRFAGSLPGFRVICPDNRGSGETEYTGQFSIEDMADDVVALLDHLGVDRAHVFGWSMGGHIAQSIAIRYPGRVRSLTLVSTYTRRPARSAYLIGSISSMVVEGKAPMEALMVAVNSLILTESRFRRIEEKGTGVRNLLCIDQPERVGHQLTAIDGYDTTDLVGSITAPTLVVHGDRDMMVDVDLGRDLHSRIAGSGYVEVPGAGHVVDVMDFVQEFMAHLMEN